MSLFRIAHNWSQGIRLYIAAGIVLYTLESWWWAEATYAGSILFATRLEELYAWTAVGLLSAALLIGPLCATWRNLPGKQLFYDARRLLGIGAAWFSLLHIGVAYSSLFSWTNPLSLPGRYQQAFAVGAVAALILVAMAVTSFNAALQRLGKWWFRLHRFVYLAAILALVHAFLIGVHAAQFPALIILTAVVLVVLGLHLYQTYVRQRPRRRWAMITVPIVGLLLITTLDFGFSQHSGYNPLAGKPQSVPQMQEGPGMPAMRGMQMP